MQCSTVRVPCPVQVFACPSLGTRRLRTLVGCLTAFVVLATPQLGTPFGSGDAEARPRPAQLHRAPHHRPVHRPHHAHRPHHVHRTTVVVAPVRAIPAVRPWYWGRVVAGVTIGTVIAVSAVAAAPTPPSPELCWYWTNSQKSRGYWDYCVAPVR
jgi:hypothetical protein